MCRSEGPVKLLRSNDQPTTIDHVAPIRPASNPGSRISARPACDMAIGACMSFCNVKAGSSIRRRFEGFTMSWAFNCATRRPSDVSGRSFAMTVPRQPDRTKSGRWILSMTSSRREKRSGYSRSSTRSAGSLRLSIHGSPPLVCTPRAMAPTPCAGRGLADLQADRKSSGGADPAWAHEDRDDGSLSRLGR